MHRRHSRIGNAKLVMCKEHFFIKRYNLYYDTCTLSNVSFCPNFWGRTLDDSFFCFVSYEFFIYSSADQSRCLVGLNQCKIRIDCNTNEAFAISPTKFPSVSRWRSVISWIITRCLRVLTILKGTKDKNTHWPPTIEPRAKRTHLKELPSTRKAEPRFPHFLPSAYRVLIVQRKAENYY